MNKMVIQFKYEFQTTLKTVKVKTHQLSMNSAFCFQNSDINVYESITGGGIRPVHNRKNSFLKMVANMNAKEKLLPSWPTLFLSYLLDFLSKTFHTQIKNLPLQHGRNI